MTGTLRELRQRLMLTQGQVAERAGISRPYYTQIESGARIPSFRVAARLAATLGMTIDRLYPLLGGTPEEGSPTDHSRR